MIEKHSIKDKAKLSVDKNHTIPKSKPTPRKGWEKSFKKMHENGDDKLLISDFFDDENFEN